MQDPSPLRVLMVSRSMPCHVAGGLERHVEDLALGLASRGVGVELLTTALPPSETERYRAGGVTPVEIRDVPPGRYSLGWFRHAGAFVDRALAEGRHDWVHAHEFGAGFARLGRAPESADPSTRRRTRFALSVHGTIDSETPLHPDLFSRLGPLGRARAFLRFGRRYGFAPFWFRSLDHADAILVDSEFTRGELARIRPAVLPRVRLVPLSARAPKDPGPRPVVTSNSHGPIRLVTVGRLEWQKGHDVALRALAWLPADAPAWRYRIVGEGRAAESLRALARRLGLADRVEFAGRLDDAARDAAIREADLFLWPERTHPAFGLAGLEAQLLGTPVVASRRGAIPEVIDPETGVMHEAEDPEGFARSIATRLRQIRDASVEDRVRERESLARRTSRRFPAERMIDETLFVYRSALPASAPLPALPLGDGAL